MENSIILQVPEQYTLERIFPLIPGLKTESERLQISTRYRLSEGVKFSVSMGKILL